MKFKINNKHWIIKELDSPNFYSERKRLQEEQQECVEDTDYIFGFCCYSNHVIYLNKCQCIEEKRLTLIHELVHCYLWSNGASYESYTEDAICDTVATSFDFINEIVSKYFKK